MAKVLSFRFVRAPRDARPSELTGHFFRGMPSDRQAQRIRELARAGLPVELIAVMTQRGVEFVRWAAS